MMAREPLSTLKKDEKALSPGEGMSERVEMVKICSECKAENLDSDLECGVCGSSFDAPQDPMNESLLESQSITRIEMEDLRSFAIRFHSNSILGAHILSDSFHNRV